MLKRIIIVSLLVCFSFVGVVVAQEPALKIKDAIMKKIGPIIPVPQPNLKPSLWINCCAGECETILEGKNYFLIKDLTVYIYNSGNESSNPATGKVELFDVLTNRNVSLSFSVGSVASKGWGSVTPRTFAGPYLVKKDQGVRVSVTFTGKGLTTPKTNTATEKGCSVLI